LITIVRSVSSGSTELPLNVALGAEEDGNSGIVLVPVVGLDGSPI
jgi:hypothetical protein